MINKRLMKLLKAAKKYLYQTVFYNWLGLVANIVAIVVFANLLSLWQMRQYEQTTMIGYLGIIIVMVIIRNITQRAAAVTAFKATGDVKATLREKVYRKLLLLGMDYKESIATSEVVQVAMEGVDQLEIYFGKYLPQLFYSLVAPLTLFIVVLNINLKIALWLLVCVPLIPGAIMLVQKIAKRLLAKYWNKYTDMGNGFLENLQGLTTLKIYQADERKLHEMNESAENFRQITMRVLRMQLNSIGVMDIVAYGGAAIGIIMTLLAYQSGSMPLSEALIIILLSAEFFIPVRLLGSFFHVAMNGNAASEKIFRLLDVDNRQSGEAEIDTLGAITISNLQYAYDREQNVIDNVNMQIKNNSFVAIVGASGCGKSTIAKILTGNNRTYGGEVQLGEVELSSVKRAEILKYITLITHQGYTFSGTIEDNLRMGKPQATVAELEAVLRKVNLLDELNELEGIKSKVAEAGSNLSGGQRQRLALARALLKDSPMYIFDEATSNIDAESEEEIVKVIKELVREKTILMISHRLEIIKAADFIYYMENGQIKEVGSHESLMELSGGYAKLYSTQKELEDIRRNVVCKEVG